jgi:ribosomal protein L11 methyltransferase
MIRLAVRCAPEYAEAVMANLIELAPNGLEEERGPGWVEYAIYGPPGEVPDMGEIRAAAGGSLVDVTTTSVPDDWADRWADFHRPIEVAGRIGVRPSWWDPKDGLIDVVVDPGRAFGTGAHPTTQLCLSLLQAVEPAPLLDVGCGSGVLSVAAALLGFAPVVAVDIEAPSIAATLENAERNGVVIDARLVDGAHALPSTTVAVANISIEAVRALPARVEAETLITSGYFISEAAELDGYTHVERRSHDGWAADLHRRA